MAAVGDTRLGKAKTESGVRPVVAGGMQQQTSDGKHFGPAHFQTL